MGNTSTHAEVARLVMEVIRRETRDEPSVLQEQDSSYFEVGNWLTDMSQLRDPFAFISGKLAVWKDTTCISWTNAEQYLEEMMGQPKKNGDKNRDFAYELTEEPPPRNNPQQDGVLTRWLQLVVKAFGFDQLVQREKMISAAEYESIFNIFYTQYYPQEHLDLPPYPDGPTEEDKVLGERIGSLVAVHKCDTPPMVPKPPASSGGASTKANCWIRVRLQDEHGHPLSKVELVLSPTDGPAITKETDGAGIVELTGLNAGTKVHVTCPLHPRDARLEDTYTTVTREVEGHPIDPSPALPPHSRRKYVGWVEPVKPTADDDLKKLAVEANISWKDLCLFNFGTDDPAKVNIALRKRVGCTRKVDRAGNYRFNGDETGVVYLPKLWQEEDLGVNRTYAFKATRADGRPVQVSPLPPASQGATPAPAAARRAEGGPRRVLGYLDAQILFVADLLTFIEHHWKRVSAGNTQDPDNKIRHRLLVLLGHACHVVEDYFFHSNFVEIAWKRANHPLRPSWRNQAERQRRERIYHRRLRAPEAKGSGLHPDKSSDGMSHVATGLFGSTDIFHTLSDFLALLVEKHPWLDDPAKALPPTVPAKGADDLKKRLEDDVENPQDSQGRMSIPEYEALAVGWDTLGWVANPERRRRLTNSLMDDVVGRHHQRLKDGTYDRVLGTLQKRKKVSARAAELFKEAFKLERDFVFESNGRVKSKWERGVVSLPVRILGPFGFLLSLVQQAEEEHNKSDEKSLDWDRAGVDGEDTTEGYNASTNGASAENLGFHSLLNKDSPNKEPFFPESLKIASRVSCYVAEIMMSQIVHNTVSVARFNTEASGRQDAGTLNALNRGHYVDWLHLLQHFLCHPDECEHNWHLQAFDLERSVDTYKKHATGHVLRWVDEKTRAERIRQEQRNALEQQYHRYEQVAEDGWKKR